MLCLIQKRNYAGQILESRLVNINKCISVKLGFSSHVYTNSNWFMYRDEDRNDGNVYGKRIIPINKHHKLFVNAKV
jgi:hypothetical protein